LQLGLSLNNLSHRVHIRHSVASDAPGLNLTVKVPRSGIWGTASVGGLNVDPSVRDTAYSVQIGTETLDQ
jgi:hypothetical protein